MKIKISTVIDMPDNLLIDNPEYKFSSAVQCITDDITNYLICKHLEDEIEWAIKFADNVYSPLSTNDPKIALTHQHYKIWSNLCKNLKWKYEEI